MQIPPHLVATNLSLPIVVHPIPLKALRRLPFVIFSHLIIPVNKIVAKQNASTKSPFHTPPSNTEKEEKNVRSCGLNPDHATQNLSVNSLVLLLLFDLQKERAVDMWQNTSEGNGRADEGIEFFVSADRELQVAGSNALDFEILGGVL
jgi:hypothetical protein